MQCQYGTDRNGIDIDGGRKAGGQERRGGKERLEQMSIPPPTLGGRPNAKSETNLSNKITNE